MAHPWLAKNERVPYPSLLSGEGWVTTKLDRMLATGGPDLDSETWEVRYWHAESSGVLPPVQAFRTDEVSSHVSLLRRGRKHFSFGIFLAEKRRQSFEQQDL